MKYIKISIYSIILYLISISIIKYLVIISPFRIYNTIIEGNNYIQEEIILELVSKHIDGKNIFNVNFRDIKNNLNKNNFIYQTKIYTKIPSSIIINISEVQPIALLEKNDSIFFLDQGLKLINANYESINHFNSTPVITNLSNNNLSIEKTKIILNKIIRKDKTIYNKLNEIRFYNDEIILLLDNNTKIILGNNKAYNKNLDKFFEFNNQVILTKNIPIENYNYINVSIPNQIIINKDEIKI